MPLLMPQGKQYYETSAGVPLVGGKIYTFDAGTSNPRTTWSDAAGTQPNTNPVILDARGEAIVFWAGNYKVTLKDALDVTIWTVDNVSTFNQENSAVDTGAVNAIALSIPQISSPVAFTRIVFKAANTNTGATTIALNGGTAKNLTWQNTSGLDAGEIQSGGVYGAIYDGTQWQLQGPTLQAPQLRTAAEISNGVIPANFSYLPEDARRYGYVADGVDGSNTGTNNTTAIQNALNCNYVVTLPSGVGLFTNITFPPGRTLRGKGARATTLRQISTSTGQAFDLSNVGGTDITDGSQTFENLCVKVATGSNGIRVNAARASMFRTQNFRLWSQQTESLGAAPYPTVAGQRGIYIPDASGLSVLFADHRLLEIRSFDIAIDAKNVVNEWKISGWFLNNRVAVRLDGCSTWDFSQLSVESGVTNARALQLFNAVSNLCWRGGRWEMTEAGAYGIDGDGTVTGANWRFDGITNLIAGDGSGIPGRKWTGTVVNDFVFGGVDIIDGSLKPFMIVPNQVSMRMPNYIKIGGSSLGNGKIELNRNAGGSVCTIEHDGTYLKTNSADHTQMYVAGTLVLDLDPSRVIFTGADSATGYLHAVRFGASGYLWVNSAGKLYIKTSGTAPTTDTDGTVVGTQT